MEKRRKLLRLLGRIGGLLLTLTLLSVSAVALILARPDSSSKDTPARALAQEPGASQQIQQEAELPLLIESFPIPVMSFMSGSLMSFVSGESRNVPLSGGYARVITLYWQTAEGVPMMLESICPADALSVLDSGYHFSNIAGPTLFGAASVRMENESNVRLHTATEDGLYVVIAPQELSGQLSALSRSLQLFTVHQ